VNSVWVYNHSIWAVNKTDADHGWHIERPEQIPPFSPPLAVPDSIGHLVDARVTPFRYPMYATGIPDTIAGSTFGTC
jgi:hypothetical protein